MRDLVFIPIKLIKDAEEGGYLRSLGYFVRMKSLYKNSVHYNYSLRSLADKLECSPACLSHHIKVLKSKNLIYQHANNLTFLGLNKLQKLHGVNNIGIPVDPKNQYDVLRCQIIRFNLSSQQYRIRKSGIQKSNLLNVPLTKTEKAQSSYTGLSAKGIGALFYLTGATGSRIRKKLNNLGYLFCKRVYSVLYDNKTHTDYINLKREAIIPIYSRYVDGAIIVERRMYMKYIERGNMGR